MSNAAQKVRARESRKPKECAEATSVIIAPEITRDLDVSPHLPIPTTRKNPRTGSTVRKAGTKRRAPPGVRSKSQAGRKAAPTHTKQEPWRSHLGTARSAESHALDLPEAGR